MGLVISAKGLDDDIFDSGNGDFTRFRVALAKAYNMEFGLLYEKYIYNFFVIEKITEEELDRMNKLSNKNLDILLQHSDTSGILKPWQCKKIYSVTKNLKCDMPKSHYLTVSDKNLLEEFNKAFLHCWKKKIVMYFH